jgi:ribose transport system ATP-binding protein
MLEVSSLVKEFGSTRALDGLDLSVATGEVHGIVGENGAGKSTLMKILSGIHQPTSGEVRFEGQPVRFRTPNDSERAGIAMIHQELNLVDELTVADNIWLGRERVKGPWLDRRAMSEDVVRRLESVGAPLRGNELIRDVSLANRQLVEIAKAVAQDARLLIMDEPTAVLSDREKQSLFALINSLRASGTTILYVSHLLDEVRELSDRITVMRDGKAVGTFLAAETTSQQLANQMVGRELGDFFPAKAVVTDSTPALVVSNLRSGASVKDVSFAVRPGEILGLAGLVGAGRTETMEALVGLRRFEGSCQLNGADYHPRSVQAAMEKGVVYVTEDRKELGLHLTMSIAANSTMANLRKYARPFIDSAAVEDSSGKWVERLKVRASGVRMAVGELSGGNQQKVSLAKWLDSEPKVLLLDEPTRGVDVGAKREIYELIQELAANGLACVVASSEMAELIGLCHRVLVLREGKGVGEVLGDQLTEQAIVSLASGVVSA